MRKIKLFMMLALLVAGVSNSWGSTYRVLFESGAVKGGYKVKNTSVVSTGDDALVLVSSQPLSSSNIGSYIEAREVEGNTAGFQIATVAEAKQMGVKVNGNTVTFDGVIFITYKYDGSVTPYNEEDENFYYSNIYTPIYGRNYGSTANNTNPRVECQIYLGEDKVAISLKNTALQNATIPVSDPNGRTVVAIQREGMVYTGSYTPDLYNCYSNYTNDYYHDTPTNRDDTYYDEDYTHTPSGLFTYGKINNNLKTVTFADNSQVASIGDYAFACCLNLTEVSNIPSTLAFLGQAAFSCCRKLTTVDFPTRSQLKSLRNYTFWYCTSIRRLALPEGLVEIEGMSSGAAMQYMTSLEDLHLPNTLKRVGPHFLCCATSLKTLTIPVSVEYIDGAFLHGCESLETCYVLGPAATLVSGSSSNPFSPNYTLCCDPVNNCTFYTTSDNLQGYQNSPAWNRINNNGTWSLRNSQYANYLTTIPAETRTFPHKWVTAVFPVNPTKTVYKSEFGDGTKLAQMTQCTRYDIQEIQGKKYRVYHLVFTEIASGEDAVIPKGVPLLIKPGQVTESFIMYETAEQGTGWFKEHATTPHEVTVVCSQDGANIIMKGQYIGHNIQPGEIYFKNNETDIVNGVEHPKFLMAPKAGYVNIGPCRCWWTIEDGDHISQNGAMGAKAAGLFGDDEPTGIDELPTRVVIDAIYDLNGRKMNLKAEELPQGLYIINGKKVLNK